MRKLILQGRGHKLVDRGLNQFSVWSTSYFEHIKIILRNQKVALFFSRVFSAPHFLPCQLFPPLHFYQPFVFRAVEFVTPGFKVHIPKSRFQNPNFSHLLKISMLPALQLPALLLTPSQILKSRALLDVSRPSLLSASFLQNISLPTNIPVPVGPWEFLKGIFGPKG